MKEKIRARATHTSLARCPGLPPSVKTNQSRASAQPGESRRGTSLGATARSNHPRTAKIELARAE